MQGLANIGNTCSINTLIQCIGHSKRLRELLLRTPLGNDKITKELQIILHQMWNEQMSLIPRRFIAYFYKHFPFFEEGVQHDICEVWMFLCEQIAKDMFSSDIYNAYKTIENASNDPMHRAMHIQSRLSLLQHNKENASSWMDLIQGQLVCQVECRSCKKLYHNFEPYTTLGLQLVDSKECTILDCMNALFHTEELSEWKCDHCQAIGNAEKVTRIWNVPKVLCVSLKRFDNNLKKSHARVKIPSSLVFTKDVVFHMKDNVTTYKLVSIALHHGSYGGGHYTAICLEDEENEQFVLFDDLNIHVINSIDTALPIIERDAYMLIYEAV